MIKNCLLAGAALSAALGLAGAIGTAAWAGAHAVAESAPVAPSSFADIFQRVAPAVVSIDVEGKATPQPAAMPGPSPFGPGSDPDGQESPFPFDFRQFFGQQEQAPPTKMEATGSGFFISPDGYILTNNHVVEHADKITVRTNDHRTLTARLIGRDPATDLAVVKVEGVNNPYVDFENKARPRVGDWVIAVGNPFNLGGTASAGIVSALARPNISGNSYVDYMQIDAPINRGNSGGPTFDVYGRVVGVNTAIISPSGGSVGIGFDIPADVAQSISRQLIATGKITRGYIGASVQDVTQELADSMGVAARKGALVADVTPDGPSAQAGLKSGDLILDVNGAAVASASDLTRRIAFARPGQDIRLTIRRDGAAREIEVHSGQRPTEAQLASNDVGDADDSENLLGMKLSPSPGGGVTIEGVSPNSDARDKGLHRGDIILRAGSSATNSPADVSAAVKTARASDRKAIMLLIRHDGRQIFIPLEIQTANG